MAAFQDITFPLMIIDHRSSPLFSLENNNNLLRNDVELKKTKQTNTWHLISHNTPHTMVNFEKSLFLWCFSDRWKKDESWETTKWVDRMTISLDIKAQFSENKTLENGKSYEVFEVCLDPPTVTSLQRSEL